MQTLRNPGETDVAYFARCLFMSAIAGATGELFTVSLDTAKVRL